MELCPIHLSMAFSKNKKQNLKPTSNGTQTANCAPHSLPKHIIAPNVVITSSILMMKYISELAFSDSLSAAIDLMAWCSLCVEELHHFFCFDFIHPYTQIE